MKTFIAAFLILAAFTSFGFAKIFFDEVTGAKLATPDSWIHDSKDLFGYVIRDPAAKKNIKIRIHQVDSNIKSPKDAAATGLQSINKKRGNRPGHPKEDLIYSKPIVTKSGIKGFVAAHGFSNASPVPYITHYYFQGSSGRVFCVCVYTNYEKNINDLYEKIVLDTLTLDIHQRANKALQLTPSRPALLSHDRFSFPSTPPQSLVARSG